MTMFCLKIHFSRFFRFILLLFCLILLVLFFPYVLSLMNGSYIPPPINQFQPGLLGKYRAIITHEDLPFCTKNLLDQRHYYLNSWKEDSFQNSLMITSRTNSCRLFQYTVKRTVQCIDTLKRYSMSLNNNRRNIHFVFLGDSRIRQQFLNFLKVTYCLTDE